jgi:hypothetical protein
MSIAATQNVSLETRAKRVSGRLFTYRLIACYLPSNRVLITGGPMHGFTATIVNAPEPGRLSLVIDGFHENSKFTVAESEVEPTKPDQPEPQQI